MSLKNADGPGVVPQPIDFNNLQCQTSLTALTGAKGIFPYCQTEALVSTADRRPSEHSDCERAAKANHTEDTSPPGYRLEPSQRSCRRPPRGFQRSTRWG